MVGCTGDHKAKGYCLRHYRQHQRGGIKPDINECAHCGKPFEPFNAQSMYCRKACKLAAWKKANPEKASVNIARSSALQAAKAAEHKAWFDRVVRPEVEALRRIARHVERPMMFMASCRKCGGLMVVRRTAGGHRHVCEPCRTEGKRALSRAYKRKLRAAGLALNTHRKRARKNGCEFDPTVSAIKVFERDGWRCKLCGVKTPKRLRGSGEWDAPELDHVVPLSLGGGHVWGNVQCACRRCNIAKGATARGQLGLEISV